MTTHIRPRRFDPRNAAIIDTDSGEVIGLAERCDACGDWIHSLSTNAIRGACATVHPYTWRCYACILARRSTVKAVSTTPLLENQG